LQPINSSVLQEEVVQRPMTNSATRLPVSASLADSQPEQATEAVDAL
jgi:hypothetical protein